MSRKEVFEASFVLWKVLRGLECHLREACFVPGDGWWSVENVEKYQLGLGCFEVSHTCVDKLDDSPESSESSKIVELPQVDEDEEVWLLKEGDDWVPVVRKKEKREGV